MNEDPITVILTRREVYLLDDLLADVLHDVRTCYPETPEDRELQQRMIATRRDLQQKLRKAEASS